MPSPRLYTDTGISFEGLSMTKIESDANLIWKMSSKVEFSDILQKVRYALYLITNCIIVILMNSDSFGYVPWMTPTYNLPTHLEEFVGHYLKVIA